jgi:hypothetical protein
MVRHAGAAKYHWNSGTSYDVFVNITPKVLHYFIGNFLP